MGQKVLIACEESQEVCMAFRSLGFESYSCDIQDCSGGHPEWHLKGDVNDYLSEHWDLLIAHPPCTYLSNSGARWMYPTKGVLSEERYVLAMEARQFFMKLWESKIPRIAIENPKPLNIANLPIPSQQIQPYEYGHPYSKLTLLWLKNLPNLRPTSILYEYKTFLPSNTGGKKYGMKSSVGVAKTQKVRSKTFHGIAQAMAEQWGNVIRNYPNQRFFLT